LLNPLSSLFTLTKAKPLNLFSLIVAFKNIFSHLRTENVLTGVVDVIGQVENNFASFFIFGKKSEAEKIDLSSYRSKLYAINPCSELDLKKNLSSYLECSHLIKLSRNVIPVISDIL